MGIIEYDFKSLKAKLANSDLSSKIDQGKKREHHFLDPVGAVWREF